MAIWPAQECAWCPTPTGLYDKGQQHSAAAWYRYLTALSVEHAMPAATMGVSCNSALQIQGEEAKVMSLG